MKKRVLSKLMSWTLILSLILGFVPGGILNVQAAETELPVAHSPLVPNGDFEKLSADWKNSGWTSFGTAYIVYDATIDSNVAKMYDPDANVAAELMSAQFAVTGGVAYDISMKLRQDAAFAETAVGDLDVYLFWYDAEGNPLDTNGDLNDGEYYVVGRMMADAEWDTYTLNVNVPAAAAKAEIRLNFFRADVNCYYIDDISFVKSAKAFTESFNGSIFSNGWTKSAGANAMIYDHAVEGKSLILQTKAGVFAQSPAIPVVPGYTYTAEFMHSKTSYDGGATYSVGSGGRASIIYTDARGTQLQETVITVGEQNGFEKAELAARAPANSAYAYIKFFVGDSYTGDPCFTVDNLIVTETVGEILQPVEVPVLTNGDFSNGTTGWSGSLTVNAEGQAVIPATEAAAYFKSGKYAAVPGEVWKLTAKAKRTSGTSSGYIGFWYVDANNQYVGNGATAIRMGADEWTDYELTWVVPEGVAYFTVEFGTISKANTEVLVDDIVLTIDTSVSLSENFDGAYVRTSWNDGKNRTNDLPAGWTPSMTETITMSLISGKWGAKDGKMLFFQAPNWIQSRKFDVIPGVTYTVSYDEMDYMVATTMEVTNEETDEVETVTVKNTGGYIQLVFVDADGNVVDTKKVAIKDDTTALVWSSNSFETVAPENAVSAYIEIGYEKVDGDAIFGIDNLKVTNNYEKPDNTIVAPTYPEYHENFDDIAQKYANWTGDYEVVDGGMKLNGTVSSDAFAVVAGNTYSIEVAGDADAAIVWYDEEGNVIEAEGNVAPEGAVKAIVSLTGMNTVVTGVVISEPCLDQDLDSVCDICGKVLCECEDSNNDHNCDICGNKLSDCADGNNDHNCDLCGTAVTTCKDENDDHFCDICYSVLSTCADDDNNHRCDICDKALNICDDKDQDHRCDICNIVLSVCADDNNDHNCDLCGNKLNDCADGNNDHNCDLCGTALSDCADNDEDHKCDLCGTVVSDCVDESKDHYCDVCDTVVSECADNNSDHNCDICSAVLSKCVDEDEDLFCDICGVILPGIIDDSNAKFSTTGLSLGTFIGMQSAIVKNTMSTGTFDEAYFIFSQYTTDANGEQVLVGTVRGEYTDMGSYYVSECPVNAKQMSDIYEITPYYVKDGITYRGVTTTTSVKAEAMKKLANAKTDDKTKALCVAMLNYGAAAQDKFAYSLTNKANDQLTDEQKVLPTAEELSLVKTNTIPAGNAKPAQSGLVAGDVVYMQFLLPKAQVNASGSVVYQISGEAAVEVKIADMGTYGAYYILEIPVKAKYFRTDISITVPEADGASYVMSCNIEAFAVDKVAKDTAVICSLMAYGDAAKAVFG